MLDSHFLAKSSDFDKLKNTYIIFITENDVWKKGLPVYEVEKSIKGTDLPFEDDLHILYVNGEYRGKDSLGDLMHDFSCPNPDDMKYEELAKKLRFYQQYKQDGKTVSNFLTAEQAEIIKPQIEERRELQKKLRTLKKILPSQPVYKFKTNAILGQGLLDMAETARDFQKRDCYLKIQEYVYGKPCDKVCLVYGLRRTGKTTLLKQIILDMSAEQRRQSVYIKARLGETIADLNQDIKHAIEKGIKYFLIDEITLIEDFIDNAALLSDVYAVQGIKFVLSGNDSLGFWFAMQDELYDRSIVIHTTFIPFKEHKRLLELPSIDDYICYGGTLNSVVSFSDDGFMLAEKPSNGRVKGLSEASLDRTYLGSAKDLLRKERDPEKQTDVLDTMETEKAVQRLMQILEIKNKENQTINIEEIHIKEIREYLKALELIEISKIDTLPSDGTREEHVIFTQPGMRFCQAEALVKSLEDDCEFMKLDQRLQEIIKNKIIEDIQGRMLEDIVYFETKRVAKKNQDVFKLRFASGEYDMVVYDKQTNTCQTYEVKHSQEYVPQQAKNLMDEEKSELTELRFGKITRKCVLYRGKTLIGENGIEYKNVEEYL